MCSCDYFNNTADLLRSDNGFIQMCSCDYANNTAELLKSDSGAFQV